LRQLRAHERDRIQKRLQALTGDEQPSQHIEDTREFAAQQADLSTERGASASAPEFPIQPSSGVRAGLHHLNGASFAELPCDNQHGVIVLGRGETATVKIDDAYVHRVHAHLRWDAVGKVHVIAHGGGENGTYVNRKRISEPVRLSSGARIRLGRSEFIYKLQ
jgi:hypothetical protein